MTTDSEIRLKGMNALIDQLGAVEAERFISLILREPFDYTRWQRNLWENRTIDEISKAAMQYRREQGSDIS